MILKVIVSKHGLDTWHYRLHRNYGDWLQTWNYNLLNCNLKTQQDEAQFEAKWSIELIDCFEKYKKYYQKIEVIIYLLLTLTNLSPHKNINCSNKRRKGERREKSALNSKKLTNYEYKFSSRLLLRNTREMKTATAHWYDPVAPWVRLLSMNEPTTRDPIASHRCTINAMHACPFAKSKNPARVVEDVI